jgi:hypothetical protein
MTSKRQKKTKPPGHADPDEYARFLEAAKQAEASDDPKDFDRAFEKVTVKASSSRAPGPREPDPAR